MILFLQPSETRHCGYLNLIICAAEGHQGTEVKDSERISPKKITKQKKIPFGKFHPPSRVFTSQWKKDELYFEHNREAPYLKQQRKSFSLFFLAEINS